jgi:hypothetical protein
MHSPIPQSIHLTSSIFLVTVDFPRLNLQWTLCLPFFTASSCLSYPRYLFWSWVFQAAFCPFSLVIETLKCQISMIYFQLQACQPLFVIAQASTVSRLPHESQWRQSRNLLVAGEVSLTA